MAPAEILKKIDQRMEAREKTAANPKIKLANGPSMRSRRSTPILVLTLLHRKPLTMHAARSVVDALARSERLTN